MSNVLVVFDNNKNGLSASKVLKKNEIGFDILHINKVYANLILSGKYGLLIFEIEYDFNMFLTLMERVQHIEKTSGSCRPVVIIITTGATGMTEESARDASSDFYFIHPVESGGLQIAIEQSLAKV